MPTATFRACIAANAAFDDALGRYAALTIAQFALTAACTRFHQVGPRLARWLLMSGDRMHATEFDFTHAFLARMLGVRRAGVTIAAASLQSVGIISYHRGRMHILDRDRLGAVACSCYASNLRAYAELIQPAEAGKSGAPGAMAVSVCH